MLHVRYYTSLLCFYLKGEIWDEGDLVHFKQPNTIFGIIPLGHSTLSMSIAHIASVDTYFKVRTMKLLAGFVLFLVGLGLVFSKMHDPSQLLYGSAITIAAVAMVLDAFEVGLSVRDTSGTYYNIDFFIFNKKNCENAAMLIKQLMSSRCMDTNVRVHADRVVQSIDAVGAKLV